MRFFRDDLTETPVRWYFLPTNAKWCGLPNSLDSRNWYGGVDDWPQIGEVQGATRSWADGSGGPAGTTGPYGTADQWLNGALVADALVQGPCPGQGPFIVRMPFPDAGGKMQAVGFEPFFLLIQIGPDAWAFPAPDVAPNWIKVVRVPGAACGYPSTGLWGICGPPPDYDGLFVVGQIVVGDCAQYFLTEFTIGYEYFPNPLP